MLAGAGIEYGVGSDLPGCTPKGEHERVVRPGSRHLDPLRCPFRERADVVEGHSRDNHESIGHDQQSKPLVCTV